MAVKEIKELEDGIKEVSCDENLENKNNWDEENLGIDEDKEDEESEEFSIGDTMLARGKSSENWGGGLEEEINEGGFNEVFDDDVFEEGEEFGSGGFSYEAVGQSSGDLYGVGSSSVGGDLYGGGGSSVNMYNSSVNEGESNLYNSGKIGGRKNTMSSVYAVESSSRKGRRRERGSELESGVASIGKKRRKGVSMI